MVILLSETQCSSLPLDSKNQRSMANMDLRGQDWWTREGRRESDNLFRRTKWRQEQGRLSFAVLSYLAVNTWSPPLPTSLKTVLQNAGNWRSQNTGSLLLDDEWKTGTLACGCASSTRTDCWLLFNMPTRISSSLCAHLPPACALGLDCYILSIKLSSFWACFFVELHELTFGPAGLQFG